MLEIRWTYLEVQVWIEARQRCKSIKRYPVLRVAEVVRGHGGPPLKSLDSDEILSPNIRYFDAN